jgi:hypothetical protein
MSKLLAASLKKHPFKFWGNDVFKTIKTVSVVDVKLFVAFVSMLRGNNTSKMLDSTFLFHNPDLFALLPQHFLSNRPVSARNLHRKTHFHHNIIITYKSGYFIFQLTYSVKHSGMRQRVSQQHRGGAVRSASISSQTSHSLPPSGLFLTQHSWQQPEIQSTSPHSYF